jgi:protein-L-isoaspartate(D-aspartate) O-methyltransferase
MLHTDIEHARFNMIVQQIRPWDVVDDRVLKALAHIPREQFVPDDYWDLAFADAAIPLGHGQSMMEPKLEARMLQALNVQPGDRVLEIGTGSGFITACLVHLGGEVTSLEIHPEFTAQAAERLEKLNLKAELQTRDALAELPAAGIWDVVAVTGSLPEMDDRLKGLLAPEGRLFAVTGVAPAMTAHLITRTASGAFRDEVLFETDLAALENAPQPDCFTF